MMMTVALRDLHRCYPDRFTTEVHTTASEIWQNNPYITPSKSRNRKTFSIGYPLIKQSNQCGLHFIQGFINDLNRILNLKVRLTEFRADIHWSEPEIRKPAISGDYWIIVSGGKSDFITKWWDPARYQQVVDRLAHKIKFVQIGGGAKSGGAKHVHQALSGVTNLVGQTNFREAMRLVMHSRGVIVPVTCFMHLAAACNKPAVVIAGGREHYTWEAYTHETMRRNMAYAAGLPRAEDWSPKLDRAFVSHPFTPHHYMHSIGALDCCRTGGCWKTKIDDKNTRANCVNVVRAPSRMPLPLCLDMITVDSVVAAVEECERGYNMEKSSVLTPAPVIEPVKPAAIEQIRSKETPSVTSSAKYAAMELPITCCVLTYGDYPHIIERCLASLYATLDSTYFNLRIGANEPSVATQAVLEKYASRSNCERVYTADPQIYKYPMMRQMLYDPAAPIKTKWMLWLDDDSYFSKPDWFEHLSATVAQKHTQQDNVAKRGYHMFGKVYYMHLRGNQEDWIKQAPWYCGVELARDVTKRPPMKKSDFCTGGFWLASMEAMRHLNWPDVRIRHNGGDVMTGVAMRQGGFGVVQSCYGVEISKAKRRGFREVHAGV